VDENVLAGLALDESKALAGIEPLNCSLFFQLCFSFLFELFGAICHRLQPKKEGHKCGLAALQQILKVLQEQQTQRHGRMPWTQCPLNSMRRNAVKPLGGPAEQMVRVAVAMVQRRRMQSSRGKFPAAEKVAASRADSGVIVFHSRPQVSTGFFREFY
jgi:hypothetical protein